MGKLDDAYTAASRRFLFLVAIGGFLLWCALGFWLRTDRADFELLAKGLFDLTSRHGHPYQPDDYYTFANIPFFVAALWIYAILKASKRMKTMSLAPSPDVLQFVDEIEKRSPQ